MKHNKVVRQVVQASGLPEDIMLGDPRILLRGKSNLLVENYQSVIEYGQDTLRIQTSLGILTVNGAGLILTAMGGEGLQVTGKIQSIAFA